MYTPLPTCLQEGVGGVSFRNRKATTMTRTFRTPGLIGFDMMGDLIDRLTAESQAKPFPPYNVLRTGEDTYTVELAVAGFSQDELAIERDGDTLRVSGKPAAKDTPTPYLHRGIAMRAFQRDFVLAPHVVVAGADLRDGILRVLLERRLPEAMKPQTIAIQTRGAAQAEAIVDATATAHPQHA